MWLVGEFSVSNRNRASFALSRICNGSANLSVLNRSDVDRVRRIATTNLSNRLRTPRNPLRPIVAKRPDSPEIPCRADRYLRAPHTRLWTALAQDYRHGFVDVEGRALRYLGDTVPDDVHGALHTRRLLLGNGWTMTEFARAAGISDAEPARCDSATMFTASARTA